MLDRLPHATYLEMTDGTKALASPDLAWRGNQVTVAFDGGDPQVYALIEAAASEWTALGGRLKLSFRRPDGTFRTWTENDLTRAADIRIGFFRDPDRDGYWSAVGTLAQRVNPGEATMNFGDLGTSLARYYGGANAAAWRQDYAHSTILHEFGHALALHHEHFHPECQADLRLPQIIAYLEGPPNGWDEEKAKFNMDATTYFQVIKSQTGGKPITMQAHTDQASVMLYSFSDSYYKSGAQSPCRPSGPLHYATTLSPTDKHFYLVNYAGGS